MSPMKDLQVLCFGEKSVLRKFVILGQRVEWTFATSMEWGLTPVPKAPPGCQMDLFLERESYKNRNMQDF